MPAGPLFERRVNRKDADQFSGSPRLTVGNHPECGGDAELASRGSMGPDQDGHELGL